MFACRFSDILLDVFSHKAVKHCLFILNISSVKVMNNTFLIKTFKNLYANDVLKIIFDSHLSRNCIENKN